MTRAEVDLRIRRAANVSDGHGNSYGILEVSPEVDEPAVLLAIRLGSTGERFGKALRLGDHVRDDGLDLEVVELDLGEPARVRLVGTVPAGEA